MSGGAGFFLSSSVDDGEVPLREKEKKVRPFSMSDTVDQSAAPPSFGALRKNQSSEDILRDAQVRETVHSGDLVLILNAFFRRGKVSCEGEQGEKNTWKIRKRDSILSL